MLHGGNSLIRPQQVIELSDLSDVEYIADLGCGRTGHFVFPFSRVVGKEGTVYAVDVLASVLESVDSLAKMRNISNVKTVWSDLESYGATNIKDETLDIAFLINTLFQTKDKKNVLKEAYRLLKKDGKLVVVDWKRNEGPLGPPADKAVIPKKLIALAEKVGFSLISEHNLSDYHFGLVFKK